MAHDLEKLRKLAKDAIAAGDRPMAVAVLTSILKQRPDDLDALLDRAELWVLAGELGPASADFSRALQVNPLAVRGLAGRGHCLVAAERFDAAEEAFTKLVELEPREPEWLLRRAATRVLRSLWAEARADYEAALLLDPRSRVAQRGVAECAAKLEEQRKEEAKMAEKSGTGGTWWRGATGPVEAPTVATVKRTAAPFRLEFDPTAWAGTGGRARFTVDFSFASPKFKQKPPAKSAGDDVNY